MRGNFFCGIHEWLLRSGGAISLRLQRKWALFDPKASLASGSSIGIQMQTAAPPWIPTRGFSSYVCGSTRVCSPCAG